MHLSSILWKPLYKIRGTCMYSRDSSTSMAAFYVQHGAYTTLCMSPNCWTRISGPSNATWQECGRLVTAVCLIIYLVALIPSLVDPFGRRLCFCEAEPDFLNLLLSPDSILKPQNEIPLSCDSFRGDSDKWNHLQSESHFTANKLLTRPARFACESPVHY